MLCRCHSHHHASLSYERAREIVFAASNIRSLHAGRNPAPLLDDKQSKMIKPLEEYSPEDRALVEFVQRMRTQPPREPQPMNWEEINAILAELPPYEETEDLGFPFGIRYKNNGTR